MQHKTYAHILLLMLTVMQTVLLTACTEQFGLHTENPWADSVAWYISSTTTSCPTEVFYVVSTDVVSASDSAGKALWQCTLSPSDREAMQAEMDWVAQHMADDSIRIVSPYYHQYTFDAICSLPTDSMLFVAQRVEEEVMQAFLYYTTTINPDRPFVLMGFSQGAQMALALLKRMSPQQYERLTAAYLLGYRLTADDICHPQVVPAQDATTKGAAISFNSVLTTEAIWPFVTEGATTCINPINWSTDATADTFLYEGQSHRVAVDTACHVLVVKPEDATPYIEWMQAVQVFAKAGVDNRNLHHWDLLFYAPFIHDNILLRSQILE